MNRCKSFAHPYLCMQVLAKPAKSFLALFPECSDSVILSFKKMKEMYLFLWSQHEFWNVIWVFYRAAKGEKTFRICTSQFSETWSPNTCGRTFFFDTFTDSVKRIENAARTSKSSKKMHHARWITVRTQFYSFHFLFFSFIFLFSSIFMIIHMSHPLSFLSHS